MLGRLQQKVQKHMDKHLGNSEQQLIYTNPQTVKSLESTDTFRNCVYFSNWSVYERNHFPIDIPIELATNIFYAFLALDKTTGNIKFSDEWCDIQLPLKSPKDHRKKVVGNLQQLFELKQLNRNLKVSMSIGGWGTHEAFSAIMSNPTKMDNFIRSSINFLLEYGFDGIDIDWEYPANRHENNLLVELLRRLRSELNSFSPNLILTIASPGGDEQLAVLNLKELDKYISFWNVMCYDFSGESWSSKTGFHSNLFGNSGSNDMNCADIIQHYLRSGINSKKLVLGMPLYGRIFHGANKPEIGQRFNKNYHGPNSIKEDIVDYKKLPINSSEEKFDYHKVSAYCYDPSSKQFIVYDNENSAKIKAKFVESKKLGGGMWWDSCGDASDPKRSLINNFVDQLGGAGALERSLNTLDIYKDSKYLKDLL